MRLIVFLTAFFGFLLSTAMADDNIDQTLWMNYKIKKGEWVYNLARQSALVKSKILSTHEVAQAIISRNPQLKNPNYVDPGQKILLPVSIIPALEKNHSATTVNYNFYINSNVYNNAAPQGANNKAPYVEKINRQPSSKKSINTTASESLNLSDLFSDLKYSVGSGIYYRLLDATLSSNNSKITQASDANYQFNIDINHPLSNSIQLHYLGDVGVEKYDLASQTIFNVGIGIGWSISEKLYLLSSLNYGLSPLISQNLTATTIEFISHPSINTSLRYFIESYLDTKIHMELGLDYLLSGSQGSVTLNSGLSYKAQVGLSRNFFGFDWNVQSWWQNTDITSNINQQKTTALGFGFWWTGSF